MRALRFLVFFDIRDKAIGERPKRHKTDLGRSPVVVPDHIERTISAPIRADIWNVPVLACLAELGFLAAHWAHLANA
jgi:hypothetical protein